MFPWLRFRLPAVVGSYVRLPLLGVRAQSLPNDLLTRFSQDMTGANTPLSQLPQVMRGLLARDRARYRDDFGRAVSPIVEQALSAQERLHGLQPGNWGDEARQTVWTTDYTPEEGGHGVVVASLEPLENAQRWARDFRLMRMMVGSFPGRSASTTPPRR